VYTLSTGRRFVCYILTPSIVKVLWDPSATIRKLFLFSQNPTLVKAVTSLQQRNFVNYGLAANQGNYLIISHPALTTATGGGNSLENYRAYRSSAAGGSHNAKIYMVDELFDQFAFGIKKNPLAIRNFIRYARAIFSV